MKNTNSLTTFNDIPGMIELTDEDLAKITAGNGFDTFNDGNHHHNDRNRHDHNRRDHRHNDHRHNRRR